MYEVILILCNLESAPVSALAFPDYLQSFVV